MPSLVHKRGTRAQINNAAAINGLKAGEVYLISDEARLTVGTAANAHQAMAKQGEGGGGDPWVWAKLASDVANTSTSFAQVTGLSFIAAANTTYLVQVIAAFQSAATTTGIAIALDIPSGSIAGRATHNVSSAALGGIEQIADAAAIAATTGVRAAATNVPITGNYIIAVGAAGGTVQLLFRSEITGSGVTMKAGLTAMGARAI